MHCLLLIGLLSSAIGLRWMVSRHPYSGQKKGPMFGDFEAQRHWMEITVNMEPNEWYQNSTMNNLSYWGLDYPPLTAYHAYLCGLVSNMLNPSWCKLNESRGHESSEHKLFMRYTVFIADILIYYPVVFYTYYNDILNNIVTKKITTLMTLLFCPLLYLIDHGHFHLGFALLAFILATRERHIFSSIAFTLALNYKQMELYHAVPIFVYLLSHCFQQKKFCWKHFFSLAVTVLISFILIWLPFLKNDPIAVLKRLFPFQRGLYEDKVANFWCTLNLIIKLNLKFSTQFLTKLCLVTTSISIIPSSIMLFYKPTVKSFYLSLFNVSMCFYLFSFQVHEKTILLPCLPIMILCGTYPVECFTFLNFALISIFPLMLKDNLVIIFWTTFILFFIFTLQRLYIHANQVSSIEVCFSIVSIMSSIPLMLSQIYVKPPKRYPDLWTVLISAYSCLLFMSSLLIFYVHQYKEYKDTKLTTKKTY